jgi:hypothetical protein
VVDCRLSMAAKRKPSTLATAIFGHVRAWACLLGAAIAIGTIPAVVHATTLATPLAAENSPLGLARNAAPAHALADPLQAPESPLESAFGYGQIVVDNAYATRGFSAAESAIIHEARGILGAAEFAQLRAAQAAGESLSVQIGGRLIQYEPGLPASSMSMFGENGFLIGREAFASAAELGKTILHELYRLETSASAGGVSAGLAASETAAAFGFAERAIGVLF